MDSSPGICTNTTNCDLAIAGSSIFIELGEDFRCPQCGFRLLPPELPETNRPLYVPILAAAVLMLGTAGSVAALYAGMHWLKVSPMVLVAQLSSPQQQQSAPPATASSPKPATSNLTASAMPSQPPAATPIPIPSPPEYVAVAPNRPFRAVPIRGGAPTYPASLAADGRPGRVLVKCDILPNGKPSRCTAKAERGGNAFPPAVLAWLHGGVAFKPILLHGKAVRETHSWRVAVAESPLALSRARRLAQHQPQQPAFNGMPVTSTRPDFPDEYAEQDRHGSVTVDCIINTNGAATDCHAGRTTGGVRFADAVMQWLANPRTKFAPLIRNGQSIAARRIWNVQYIP